MKQGRSRNWTFVWAALIAAMMTFMLSRTANAQTTSVTDLTTFQQWQFLATFLPIVVGIVIQRGWPSRVQATAAIGIYVAYGLLGSFLAGDLNGLTWGSFLEVVTSIMKVTIIAYTAYSTLWRAVPVPQFVESITGGDPMVDEIPRQNVA